MRPLGKSRISIDNTKMNLRDVVREGQMWVEVAQILPSARDFGVSGVETAGSATTLLVTSVYQRQETDEEF